MPRASLPLLFEARISSFRAFLWNSNSSLTLSTSIPAFISNKQAASKNRPEGVTLKPNDLHLQSVVPSDRIQTGRFKCLVLLNIRKPWIKQEVSDLLKLNRDNIP